ncbi:DUF1653 domain-containing protein [Aquabacterium sp.]|uniref:DUF1653 domain-containing protein n=1 Tax=Aquabacterium sp. TaxID=1872578 RepID=UPI0035B45827
MTLNTHDRPVAPLPSLPTGIYRHYKGGRYEVYGVARHSETLEPVVVYRPLYGERALWVRPFAMFTERIEAGGESRLRFELETPRAARCDLA